MQAVRVAMTGVVDDTARTMIGAWAEAWAVLAEEWQSVADELAGLAADGEWPRPSQVERMSRANQALRHTTEQLTQLVEQSGATMTGGLESLMGMVDQWEHGIVGAQLPAGPQGLLWDRISIEAVDAIVERTAERFWALSKPIPVEQAAAMRHELVRGVAVGENPREVARRLMDQLEGQFVGGQRRAEVIARTEMLDAYREAAELSRATNADVLKGWMWVSQKSERTCPACLAMDGELFPADEPGPLGHVCCRCTAAPVTKPFRELGIDVDEPPSDRQSGREWFDTLSPRAQERIMGRERLRRLQDGELSWDDIPRRSENPDWRASYGTAPLGRG